MPSDDHEPGACLPDEAYLTRLERDIAEYRRTHPQTAHHQPPSWLARNGWSIAGHALGIVAALAFFVVLYLLVNPWEAP